MTTSVLWAVEKDISDYMVLPEVGTDGLTCIRTTPYWVGFRQQGFAAPVRCPRMPLQGHFIILGLATQGNYEVELPSVVPWVGWVAKRIS